MKNLDDLTTTLREQADGQALRARLGYATLNGEVLASKETANLFNLEMSEQPWLPTVVATATQLQSRICYCSVFDECHVIDSRKALSRPERVARCEAPTQAFRSESQAGFGDGAASAPAPAPASQP